jgi:hypothetical protein
MRGLYSWKTLPKPLKSRRSACFSLPFFSYSVGNKEYQLKECYGMKKTIAKILMGVMLASLLFSVNTYAGENDIPRMFNIMRVEARK